MPWLVRYTSRSMDAGPFAAGTAQPVDLLDRHALLVSALWNLGTGGVAEQALSLVAGFEDLTSAHAAADLAEQHGLVAGVEAVDDSWVRHEPELVSLTTGSGVVRFPIVAGPAFGHGGHPTTRLCLELMSRVLGEGALDAGRAAAGCRVLDVGTGSGVLAIAAARLGATDITASDVDAAAIDSARFNTAANEVDVQLIAGDVADMSAHPDGVGAGFDLIVANVLLVVHREVADTAVGFLAPGGVLVVAGFLTEQADRVVDAYRTRRPTLDVIDRVLLDDWCGLVLADPSTAR